MNIYPELLTEIENFLIKNELEECIKHTTFFIAFLHYIARDAKKVYWALDREDIDHNLIRGINFLIESKLIKCVIMESGSPVLTPMGKLKSFLEPMGGFGSVSITNPVPVYGITYFDVSQRTQGDIWVDFFGLSRPTQDLTHDIS